MDSHDEATGRRAVVDILTHVIGEDINRDGLAGTPQRVIRAWCDMTKGYDMDPAKLVTTFDGEEYDAAICVGPVKFYSTCEHHMLPFFGDAWVAYIPGVDGRIIGLSKMPRLVEMFSRRLQNQERMTQQIATTLNTLLDARGTAVLVRGQHFCMMARGVKQDDAYMTTSVLTGAFRDQPQTRAEFFELTRRQ